MNFVAPILMLSGLGVLFGAILALASKKFCVHADPRMEAIFEKLPGANCGACGLPGCMGFAEALIHGRCTIDKCAVMNEQNRQEIAAILGIDTAKKVKRVAVLHCHGGSKRVKDKFVYEGIQDCVSANLVMGGPKACVYGCIGLSSCVKACPFGAISMNEENLPVVDEEKCTACAKCVIVCPKHLFSIVDAQKNYAVRCKSLDLGKKVMEVCLVGCIACRKCEKACPLRAIKIVDNLSIIDYNICDNKGECFKVCPTKAIAKKEKGSWVS
jgi:RnfABCDGE-type electron transport complex B subunit